MTLRNDARGSNRAADPYLLERPVGQVGQTVEIIPTTDPTELR